jgi:hypothetical protein
MRAGVFFHASGGIFPCERGYFSMRALKLALWDFRRLLPIFPRQRGVFFHANEVFFYASGGIFPRQLLSSHCGISGDFCQFFHASEGYFSTPALKLALWDFRRFLPIFPRQRGVFFHANEVFFHAGDRTRSNLQSNEVNKCHSDKILFNYHSPKISIS